MQPCTHQLVVSTHASVRRRQVLFLPQRDDVDVSTHASVRRRLRRCRRRLGRRSFNSRLREEATVVCDSGSTAPWFQLTPP